MSINKILLLITFLIFTICEKINSQAHLIIGETIFEDGNKIVSTNNNLEGLDIHRSLDNNSRIMMAGDTLFDQSQLINYPGQGSGGANVSGTTGMLFGVNANINSNFILADDFTIPLGELWIIDSIIIFNYQTGSTTTSTINAVRMQIRQGTTPGFGSIVFGDLTTNRLATTYFSGIYRTAFNMLLNTTRPIMKSRVNTSALSLSSGSYIIEHLVGGTLPSGPFSPLRTIGTTHVATGNGFQFNTTWNNILEFDSNGNNPLPKGLTFLIYGTSLEDKEAEVNGINYNTLQEAINAVVNDGDEITLLKNVISSTINVGVNNKSVVMKADGFTCTINQLNISNGEYLRWTENNLTITGGINNTSSILWNNANITIPNFTNTGVYKGTGTLNGNMINQNSVRPGN